MHGQWDGAADETGARLSRRQFVTGCGAVTAGAMLSQLWPSPAAAVECRGAPPEFPRAIALRRADFENWSKEIRVRGLWTATPRTATDVCVLADWARMHGWILRPRGAMHTWAPLTVAPDTGCERTLLVDTRQLNGVEIVSTGEVRAGAGVLVDDLLAEMERAGLGLTACPAIGGITLGGALAVGAHGSSLPAGRETPVPGAGYGSLSDLVLSVSAVVWSPPHGRHVLRAFDRGDPHCDALMVHLGRAFVTEVRLRAVPNYRLRCVSRVDVPAAELFGPPGSGGRTFGSLLERTGRVEAIWYPFTDKPWLKLWSISPIKPLSSRAVSGPYNYPFSDNLPDTVADLTNALVTGHPEVTPLFGQTSYAATAAGLAATASSDLWGWSKDTLLYIRATTLRVAEMGYGILCARPDVQWVLNSFIGEYARRLAEAARADSFPINMPLDVRVTGVDDATAVGLAPAHPPLLSALAPLRRRPEWDAIVWLNVLDLTGTRGAPGFKAGLEAWITRTFDGQRALGRAEWSKGWAYDDAGPWRPHLLGAIGAPYGHRPVTAMGILDRLDPHSVFHSPLIDAILG
jgi:FAD/FMN-containing dehydrogenase